MNLVSLSPFVPERMHSLDDGKVLIDLIEIFKRNMVHKKSIWLAVSKVDPDSQLSVLRNYFVS